MVPPGVQPDDSGAGKSADTVGFQPFTARRVLEVVENLFGEVDHDLCTNR